MSRISAPKGVVDILPEQTGKWQTIERIARETAELYHFGEIRIPIFEHSELFHRGVGETTDIVSKETYTFPDRENRSLTLRPEGTAGVVRAGAGSVSTRLGAGCGVRARMGSALRRAGAPRCPAARGTPNVPPGGWGKVLRLRTRRGGLGGLTGVDRT